MSIRTRLGSLALAVAGVLALPTLAQAAVPGGYPTQVITRPLTAPQQMAEITASYDRLVFLGMDSNGVGVSGRYGIDNKLEVSVATGLRLNPNGGWNEAISVGAAYSLLDTNGLDLAARLDAPLNFGGGDVLNQVTISTPLRWQAAPKIALRAGDGLLSIFPGDDTYTTLTGNVAGEYQVNDKLALGLGTELFQLQLTGDGDYTRTVADALPLRIYGLYAVSQAIDVFARVTSMDVGEAGNFHQLSVGANVRF